MLSKGYMRNLSHLALARAFLVSSTRVEEEDLVRDGLVPRGTIDAIREYRVGISDRVNDFLAGVYRKATEEERAMIKRLNDNTVNKAMTIIYKQLIDMDYVAIYLLEHLHDSKKSNSDIKALINLDELKEMKSLVERTYVGDIRDKRYISKFEHIVLIKKIIAKTS